MFCGNDWSVSSTRFSDFVLFLMTGVSSGDFESWRLRPLAPEASSGVSCNNEEISCVNYP